MSDQDDKGREMLRLIEQGELDVRDLTPGEQIGMVWPLTVEAWAKKGIDISQQRMSLSFWLQSPAFFSLERPFHLYGFIRWEAFL